MTDDYTEPLLPHEVIARARKDIQQYGWHQGSLWAEPRDLNEQEYTAHTYELAKTAPTCILGALNRATTGCPWTAPDGPMPYLDSVQRALKELRPNRIAIIPAYNDESTTTVEGVVSLLERAEAIAFDRLVEGSW